MNKTDKNNSESKLEPKNDSKKNFNNRRCSIKMRTSLIDDTYQNMPRVVILERTDEGLIKYNLKISTDELINSDQYEYIKTISSGGFGIVNLCKNNSIINVPKDKEIAIKLFTRGGSEAGQLSNERLKSIESELNYIRIFKHPNIIQYYGILSPSTGQIGFAMEYLDGGTVFEVLYSNLNVIPLSIRKSWCVQLLSAVLHLHEGCMPFRFIHRDIKTINLLIDKKDFSIKLCDFGNVRERTFSYYRLENNGGSVRYMSPESLKIGSFINDKTDIWSIGCCIIEIFGGGIPYNKYNDEQVLVEKIKKGITPEIPSFFPNCLKKICSKCLLFDPNSRPNSLQLFREIKNLDINVLRKSKLINLDRYPRV